MVVSVVGDIFLNKKLIPANLKLIVKKMRIAKKTESDYNDCMECMREQTNSALSSNDDDESGLSGCSKYKKGFWEYPIIWQLLAGLAGGGTAIALAASTKKLNAIGNVLVGQMVLALTSAILSGVQAGFMYAGMGQAASQQEALEGVQKEFLGAIALRCPNGREDERK